MRRALLFLLLAGCNGAATMSGFSSLEAGTDAEPRAEAGAEEAEALDVADAGQPSDSSTPIDAPVDVWDGALSLGDRCNFDGGETRCGQVGSFKQSCYFTAATMYGRCTFTCGTSTPDPNRVAACLAAGGECGTPCGSCAQICIVK